jgi:hypothetical protein
VPQKTNTSSTTEFRDLGSGHNKLKEWLHTESEDTSIIEAINFKTSMHMLEEGEDESFFSEIVESENEESFTSHEQVPEEMKTIHQLN